MNQLFLRILVCGGRDYDDMEAINFALDRLHKALRITTLIHGCARGADRIAGEWARNSGVQVEEFRANWASDGRAAGSIRNQRMLDEGRPDGVVAFPGGKGTADMVTRAQRVGMRVWFP